MQFSTLNESYAEQEAVTEFYGYNHTLKLADGEFYDMKNMCSDYYPLIGTRDKRFNYTRNGYKHIYGICVVDNILCVVENTSLFIGGREIPNVFSQMEEKTLVAFGTYLLIFPDKIYYNVRDNDDHGSMDSVVENLPCTFSLCDSDGTDFDDLTVSSTTPSDPKDGQYWIDTSNDNYILKRYYETNSTWASIGTQYIRINANEIADHFEEGDAVTFKFDGTPLIYKTSSQTWAEASTSKQKKRVKAFKEQFKGKAAFIVQRVEKATDRANDFIVVIGNIMYSTQCNMTIKRQVPNMDFVIECGNRVWGCRYGKALNNEFVNEIYASKLGDFKNWSYFGGTSQDSYTASCGTSGPWTGAIKYNNYPFFFKNGYMHKVYGSYPSQYQVLNSEVKGVMQGDHKSLAVVDDVIFYKSYKGVCYHDGSKEYPLYTNFGKVDYASGACGASYNDKYYLSMKDETTGEWSLFVYDSNNHIWHKEDDLKMTGHAVFNSLLYAVYEDYRMNEVVKERRCVLIQKSNLKESQYSTLEDDFDWMIETGNYGLNMVDNKFIGKLFIRMSLVVGARAHFYIQYDSSGEWEPAGTVMSRSCNSFSLPLRPRRCDHFKIKVEGHGASRFYSIAKSVENGGEPK